MRKPIKHLVGAASFPVMWERYNTKFEAKYTKTSESHLTPLPHPHTAGPTANKDDENKKQAAVPTTVLLKPVEKKETAAAAAYR